MLVLNFHEILLSLSLLSLPFSRPITSSLPLRVFSRPLSLSLPHPPLSRYKTLLPTAPPHLQMHSSAVVLVAVGAVLAAVNGAGVKEKPGKGYFDAPVRILPFWLSSKRRISVLPSAGRPCLCSPASRLLPARLPASPVCSSQCRRSVFLSFLL